MTPRERWLGIFRREPVDRLPTDYWATPEADRKLKKHLGCITSRDLCKRLQIDRVISVSPTYIGPTVPPDEDIFGCRHAVVSYGTGTYRECVEHPLARFGTVGEIEAGYTWPKADWYDYSSLSDQLRGWESFPIRGGGSEPFLIYKKLRGQEQAFIDLVEHPDIVHYCLDRLFDLAYENTRRTYQAIPGRVMISYVAEDMGGQRGLMMSPLHIREFLLPRMKRIIDQAHAEGAYVFHHNDGAIRDILPDLIDLGIDLLNPIQWRCDGMDREGLKRDFGDRVVLHGGMDNQETLVYGTEEEVRQEVRDNVRILGEGGGYVLAPCHNIQAVSPVENIVAMYEECNAIT